MSVLSSIKSFFVKAPSNIDTEAKKILDKANADIASLRKKDAAEKHHTDVQKSLAAAKAVYEEHVKLLNEPSTAPAGATGATGAAS